MELHQLRIFKAVTDTGNFSRAADAAFLTQPAVSMQVKALEEELGQALFYRERKRSVLTPAGEILLRHARALIARSEQAVQEIADLQQLKQGHISIACSDTFAAYVLTDMIGLFSKTYPNIRFSVYNGTTNEIAHLLINHDADIGYLLLPFHHPRIACREWMTYRDVAVSGSNHPSVSVSHYDLRTLVEEQLLILEKGTATRESFDSALAQAGLATTRAMELGSVAVQKEFAAAGIGIAVVPEYSVKIECEDGRLVGIPVHGLPQKKIGLCYLKEKESGRAVQTFITQSSKQSTDREKNAKPRSRKP